MSLDLLSPGTTPQRRNPLAYHSKALFEFRPGDLKVALTDDGAGADRTTFTARSGQTGYFARNSAGLFVTRGGLIASAFKDLPRLFHSDRDEDDNFSDCALILEGGARTSLVTSLDISTWTDVAGTPTVAAVAGPGAAFSGYTITDNEAGAEEAKGRTVAFTADAGKTVAVCVKKGTSVTSSIRLRDTSASADRLLVTITWSGTSPGTPTVSPGSLIAKYPLASDWWLLLFQTTSVTAANTNQLWLYGASTTAADEGTTSYALPLAENASFPGFLKTASLAQAAESLYFDFRPAPQGMTGYFRFRERGTFGNNLGRLCHIGLTDATTDPRLFIAGTGSVYAMTHANSSSVASTLGAAPAIGDLVELRCELFGNEDSAPGAVRLHQSIGEATETSATKSAANSLGATWGGSAASRLYLCSDPAGGNAGFAGIEAAAWAPGTGHTMAALRRRFA